MVEAVRILGIKDAADEEEMQIVEYRSLIGITPSIGASWLLVEEIAECLSVLTPGQLDAVKRLCIEFSLTFADVDDFFDFVVKTKDISRGKFKREGIPAPRTDEGDE
jgi:hypothetical protein